VTKFILPLACKIVEDGGRGGSSELRASSLIFISKIDDFAGKNQAWGTGVQESIKLKRIREFLVKKYPV
jgi:hypothetical protein